MSTGIGASGQLGLNFRLNTRVAIWNLGNFGGLTEFNGIFSG